MTDALERQLIAHEEMRLRPYDDKTGKPIVLPTGGKITIGCGHNLTDRGLTLDQCLSIFRDDVAAVIGELDARFEWFRDLDATRQAVVIDMGFNIGVPKLALFYQTIKAIATRRYRDAAVHMLQSRWAEQVGNRAVTLAAMMDSGINPFAANEDARRV